MCLRVTATVTKSSNKLIIVAEFESFELTLTTTVVKGESLDSIRIVVFTVRYHCL